MRPFLTSRRTRSGSRFVGSPKPPPLPVTTLAGEELSVPDAASPAMILVIGFSRESGQQTEPWRNRLEEAAPAVPVRSVAMMEGVPRLMKGMLVRMIRSAVPEHLHPSFYLIHERGDEWRELVGAGDEATGYVLRIDAGGRVCFRYAGEVTDDALAGALGADCATDEAASLSG